MVAWVIPKLKMKNLFVVGIAALVMPVLVFRYLVNEDAENADLSYLQGRSIIIDAGHGGIDSGARYNQLLEKNINLAIAQKLGNLLKDQGMEVSYTRESDIDYYTKGKGGKRNDLMTRVDMINQSSPDIFVSIHCNAVKGNQWYGAQVFYHPRLEDSKRLAEAVQLLLKKFPPNNKRAEKEDTKILILNMTQVPGVLVEVGYLSNQREAVLLADDEYQNKMALQIVKAIANYFKNKHD